MSIADRLNGIGEVPRDRWGRPLIIPADGGTARAYTRCTTFIKALEDTWALQAWAKRRVARGLADRPDLLLAVGSIADEYSSGLTPEQKKAAKKDLDKVCEEAMQAAASNAAATIGTALHKIAERLDRGETFKVPIAAREDIAAYQAATEGFRRYFIETLTVNDDLEVAGTPDRVLSVDGVPVIGDIKTGSIDYGLGTIAMQLAVYAHSVRYDPATGERSPLTVNQERGLVIHLPAGQARCDLVWVDLVAGWDAVRLASEVRQWRARKNVATPYQRPIQTGVIERLRTAETVEELSAIYRAHKHTWTKVHTEVAKRRKAALGAGA